MAEVAMTRNAHGSPPKPGWRGTITGIGSVGCMVASAGAILMIVAFSAAPSSSGF